MLLQLTLQSHLLSRLSETPVAHWAAILSAAVPKKGRVPREEGRREDVGRSAHQISNISRTWWALGKRGVKETKRPNNLMAELEESIYSYSGTLERKAFPGCTDIHNTDNSG